MHADMAMSILASELTQSASVTARTYNSAPWKSPLSLREPGTHVV